MKYSEFVEKLKTGTVYTHGGEFQPDDVLSAALINQVCDHEGIPKPDFNRIPWKDLETIDQFKDEIAFSVGNDDLNTFYDVFQVVGEELYGPVAHALEKQFVEPMNESDDNPVSVMISEMNPNWNETFSRGEAFQNAVRIAEQMIQMRAEGLEMGKYDIDKDLTQVLSSLEEDISITRREAREAASESAINIIHSGMDNIITIGTESGKEYDILPLDQRAPYSMVLKETAGTNVVGYTFPTQGGITYKPLDETQLSVPDRWKGAEEFDIEGMTYCHRAGISLGFDDMESCINAAQQMANEMELENDLTYDGDEYMQPEEDEMAL